jgi:hypothetical protein
MNTKTLMIGAALLGTVFTGSAIAEEIKAHSETCLVQNGQGYKWKENVDKDSSFHDAKIKTGEVVKGPIFTDRNLNRTTEIGVVGIYFKDPSCNPK